MMVPSLAVMVRDIIRPSIAMLGVQFYINYRILQIITSPARHSFSSENWEVSDLRNLLDVSKDMLTWMESYCHEQATAKVIPSSWFPLLAFIIKWVFLLFQDLFAIMAVVGTSRVIYCAYHCSFAEWKAFFVQNVYRVLKPSYFKESDKMIPEIISALGRDPNRTILTEIPNQGREPCQVLAELSKHASEEHVGWNSGKVSGTVYSSDPGHLKLMHDTYALYSVANSLYPGIWPKLNQCEAEVVLMTSSLLHGTGIGSTSSGGTESILLAIKAHLVFYGKQRGIVHPELICGSTAHASVDKACEILGIRKVCIECSREAAYTLCPKQVQKHVTSNTIMIFASAPNFPQGTIDPIEALGEIALRDDIGLHVDACLGGFVLPFAIQLGYTFPKFDFQVPGVTSMSSDTHKFGYAAKGTSVVLYRDFSLRRAQYFCYGQWSGGIYATPTFAGSRPSALIGCAWASLVSIGKAGFQERTKCIVEASSAIANGVSHIEGLHIVGDQNPSMVVCFGSSEINIYRVADAMKKKGWDLNSLQSPACVHICVTMNVAPHANDFLYDLRNAVEEVKLEDPSDSNKGTAGIYGMSGSIPDGPVNALLREFLDLRLIP